MLLMYGLLFSPTGLWHVERNVHRSLPPPLSPCCSLHPCACTCRALWAGGPPTWCPGQLHTGCKGAYDFVLSCQPARSALSILQSWCSTSRNVRSTCIVWHCSGRIHTQRSIRNTPDLSSYTEPNAVGLMPSRGVMLCVCTYDPTRLAPVPWTHARRRR